MIDPNMIMANSNPPTGPSPSTSSSTNAGIDHKMVPAAIGSERKRHVPIPIATSPDWSSIPKRMP